MATRLPRCVPTGGGLVTVERIIGDTRERRSWDVWLAHDARVGDGRWVLAETFITDAPTYGASFLGAPSGLAVVARPTPPELCHEGWTPADPHEVET